MQISKTAEEIQHLRDKVVPLLDVNEDGVVVESEFEDSYLFAEAELDAFAITTFEDWRFWSALYQPGTAVEQMPDGEFFATASKPALRQHLQQVYAADQLAYEYINIEEESAKQIEQARLRLQQIEQAWIHYYDQQIDRYDADKFRQNFPLYCDKTEWQYQSKDPYDVAYSLTDEECRQLYVASLILDFYRQIHMVFDAKQLSLTDFLNSTETNKRISCGGMSALTLHLLKFVREESFRPVILAEHVTLALETEQGPIYLEAVPEMGIRPTNFYEDLLANEQQKRFDAYQHEYWDILGAAYTNKAALAYNDKNWDSAKNNLKMAIEITPHNATAQYLLGRIWQRQGESDQAKQHYNQSLEISHNYQIASKALKSLD